MRKITIDFFVCIVNTQLNIVWIQLECIFFDATIPARRNTEIYTTKHGLYRRAELRILQRTSPRNTYALLPASLAVTKGILVSFYYCAAPTDMFKFSAYPHSSWCALLKICDKKCMCISWCNGDEQIITTCVYYDSCEKWISIHSVASLRASKSMRREIVYIFHVKSLKMYFWRDGYDISSV